MRLRTPDPKVELLRRLPAFADASGDKMADVAAALDVIEVPAGTTILTEGQFGHEFYLVIDGVARVTRDGRFLAQVSRGDVLGELALVGPGRRTATVVAETDMVLATSTRPYFAGLLMDFPAFRRQVRAASDARLEAHIDMLGAA